MRLGKVSSIFKSYGYSVFDLIWIGIIRKKDGQIRISFPEVMYMLSTVWLMLSTLLYSLQLNTGSFPRPLSEAEEQRYLILAKEGDLEARNILIERNLRLVAHIMKKYYTQTADQEDLISIGTLGLIKGVETFDISKGARLATYAARCVENEILMYFRSQRKSAQDVSLSDYIETGVKPIQSKNGLTLVEIHLVTGKTHQIRAHLASCKHPILGDYKYGNKHINDRYKEKYKLESQLLHAYRLELPALEEPLQAISDKKFVAPLPKLFNNILKAEQMEG